MSLSDKKERQLERLKKYRRAAKEMNTVMGIINPPIEINRRSVKQLKTDILSYEDDFLIEDRDHPDRHFTKGTWKFLTKTLGMVPVVGKSSIPKIEGKIPFTNQLLAKVIREVNEIGRLEEFNVIISYESPEQALAEIKDRVEFDYFYPGNDMFSEEARQVFHFLGIATELTNNKEETKMADKKKKKKNKKKKKAVDNDEEEEETSTKKKKKKSKDGDGDEKSESKKKKKKKGGSETAEGLMQKLLKEKTKDKDIVKAFKQFYKDKGKDYDTDYVKKRVAVYKRICES